MEVVRKTIGLHRVQKAFRDSQARYRGFVGGINSGKSWIGAYDLIRRARRGRLYLVGAPTYQMLADATIRTFSEVARDYLGVLPPEGVQGQRPHVTLTTGAEILFRSADDPERLRGPNLTGIWLDEASLMHEDVYSISIGRLREGGEHGWMTTTFTPKGQSHWTYSVFGKASAETELFHARTRDNPFGPPGFHEALAKQYGGLLAEQELEGRFVNLGEAEWPADYFPGDPGLAQQNGESGVWFRDWPEGLVIKVIALDPSLGRDAKHGDYSAFALVGIDSVGTFWVDADLARRPSTRTVQDGLDLYVAFNAAGPALERRRPVDRFVVEANQFQSILLEDFARIAKERNLLPGVPLVGLTNTINKVVRIRTLGSWLAQGKMRFRCTPGGRLLVQQLREFPAGVHDDGPDALEMAVRMIRLHLGMTA